MADYPSVTQVIGTQITGDDGMQIERSVSGKARLRSLYSAVQFDGTLVHECDGPEKDQIMAHWLAHRSVSFNVVYQADGKTYLCWYAGMPTPVPVAGTDRWRVTAQVIAE